MNFRQYKNITKVIIPDSVNISNDFSNRFNNMSNLQLSQIPNNVTNMSNTYHNCTNLTTAVCGPNVTSMTYTYHNCTNLTTAVCGPNVTSMSSTYLNCTNLTNVYLYSDKITNSRMCFRGKNTSKSLNIYLPSNSSTLTTVLYTNTLSIIGSTIMWTNDSANSRYYNATQNIYIYPVTNVEATRIANGD